MHVTELYELTKWIDAEIVAKQIVEKYQALHTILNQNAQPNRPQQPFESQKNDLIETLGSVPLDTLTIDQLEFLKKLSIAQYLGDEGTSVLEDILFKNVIDIATSASRINEIIQNIENGINKSKQIRDGLKGCVDLGEPVADKILVRVNFSGHAAMANLADFKKWGDIWYDIGRGVAMANNVAPEEVIIVGAKKGSVILELAAIYAIVSTMSMILLNALKVADRALEIRKKAEEIRGLKLVNDKFARDLEKEAKKEKEKGIENILKKIIKHLGIKEDGEGDKVNALDKSVKNLVDFIEKGGEIDFVMPKEPEATGEEEGVDKKQVQRNKELRNSFEEIRRLEHKIRQIEYKNP
jgi:hypothetical protein